MLQPLCTRSLRKGHCHENRTRKPNVNLSIEEVKCHPFVPSCGVLVACVSRQMGSSKCCKLWCVLDKACGESCIAHRAGRHDHYTNFEHHHVT